MGRGSENYGGFFNNSQFTQQNQFGQQPQPGNQGGLFGQQPQQQAFHGGLPQQQFQAQNQQPQLGYNFGGQPQQQFQQQLQNQQPQQYQFQPQLQPLGGPPPGNQGFGAQQQQQSRNTNTVNVGGGFNNSGGPPQQFQPQTSPFAQPQFAQQQNSLTLSDEDKLLISETDELIRKLPVLLEQSVFQNKSIDLANLGKKIAKLSNYKEEKLWGQESPPGHNTSEYTKDIDFEKFAERYAESRLNGRSADFSSLKNTIVAKLYITNKKKQVENFEEDNDTLKQYKDCANQLDNTIKWHDDYIANIIDEARDIYNFTSDDFVFLPKGKTEEEEFQQTMTTRFSFKEPLIYVKDGKLFKLECSDFQEILENRKYPEFPIAFIALKYQRAKRAFIFNKNNIKLVKYFEKIIRLFNDDTKDSGSHFETNDKLAIIAYAEEHMAIIRGKQIDSHSFGYTYKGGKKTIKGQDLFEYYYNELYRTHKPTVKDFVIKLGIFSDKMNNPGKQVTIESKEDAYNEYKYLEEILTKEDKQQIESWKQKRQKLTKTDRNDDYDNKSQKSDAIKNIFKKAKTRFNKDILGKNLAQKGFGRKFFKTVEEYVKIDKLDDLITEIYDTTDFKGKIFNDVKKISDLEKIVNKKITSKNIGLSAKGLCLMGVAYAYADYIKTQNITKKIETAKTILNQLPKTIKNLDRTGLRKTTLVKSTEKIEVLNGKVIEKYGWGK